FADPGVKDVPNPAAIGHPIAECDPDGSAVITKLPETGGLVSFATCAEQLLYEIHDPAAYRTPDVTADFSRVELLPEGPDRVRVRGASGSRRPELLKVSVGYRDGYIGEGQISYAGEGCVGRGRLAGEMVADRLEAAGLKLDELRIDLIGCDALGGSVVARRPEPAEVRLRVAARCASSELAREIGLEVKALWLAGPAGGPQLRHAAGAGRWRDPLPGARHPRQVAQLAAVGTGADAQRGWVRAGYLDVLAE